MVTIRPMGGGAARLGGIGKAGTRKSGKTRWQTRTPRLAPTSRYGAVYSQAATQGVWECTRYTVNVTARLSTERSGRERGCGG